jgi:hypothetical protein
MVQNTLIFISLFSQLCVCFYNVHVTTSMKCNAHYFNGNWCILSPVDPVHKIQAYKGSTILIVYFLLFPYHLTKCMLLGTNVNCNHCVHVMVTANHGGHNSFMKYDVCSSSNAWFVFLIALILMFCNWLHR